MFIKKIRSTCMTRKKKNSERPEKKKNFIDDATYEYENKINIGC